ncbi:alternate-type signal peptide domain-containing protein [Nocardioides mangrovi]|uniref:Alternate-type signal peptide domain-containing protein n=1 Tax=Nocardioides mangrovi TaxID=2874580 RepID=A0ABS7UBY8_9ACTN|nr:alternate-type signal peptide domain-containing protein [Nocardioides mangrovi]MBZ5738491.1 alternate-type signal peptide domain-containing protein [Nocardioides mangrovi]
MRKSTKGAVAAAAAAVLLIGAWGTQASWSGQGTTEGTDVATGYIKLVPDCDGWLFGGDPFDAVNDLLVPGSILDRHCTFTVDVAGVMTVALSTSTPSFSNDSGGLGSILQATASFTDADGDDIPDQTVVSDGDVINVDVTVKLLSTVTDGQDLSATLDDIVVSATQV